MTMATEDTQSAQARPMRSNLLRKQSEIEEVDEEDTSPGSDQSDTTITAGTETPRVTGGSPESGSPDDLKTSSTEISHHHHNHKHISPKIQKLTRSEALCEDCASPPLDPLQSTASTCSTDSSSSGIGSKSQTSGSTTSSFRGRLEKDGSQSSEAGTSSSLSRDSSVDTPYKDSTGIDLEDFIRKTLNKTPKDRSMLIKLEGDLVKFIREPKHHYLKFPQMSSYDRMLVHRIAAFFGLDHNVDQTGKCVIVNKTQNTRIPDFSFQEHIYSSESKPKMLLKRGGGGSFDELQSKNLEKPSFEDMRAKSLEERQQRYDEARNRIFTVDESQPTGYSQEDASATGIVLKTCRPQSLGSSLGSSREDHTWSSLESSGYGTDSSCRNRIPVPKANSFGGMGSFSISQLKIPMRGGSLSKADSMCSGGANVNLGNMAVRQIILSTSPTCSQSDNSSISGSCSSGLAPSPQQQTGSMPMTSPSPHQKFYWVASDLSSIPPGSVVINPQTGQPFSNPDGTAYRYTPGQPLPQPGPGYALGQQPKVYQLQQQPQQSSVDWTAQHSQDSTSSGELCQQMSVMRMTPQSSTDSCGDQAIPTPQPGAPPIIVGQTMTQQYPQSPVQGVPGTQTIIYPSPQNLGSQPVRYMCSMNYSTPTAGGSIPQSVGPGEGPTAGQPAQQQYTTQFVHGSYPPCNQVFQAAPQGQVHVQGQTQGQEVSQTQNGSYPVESGGETGSVPASSVSNGVSYQVQYSQGGSMAPNQSHMAPNQSQMYYMVQSHQPQMGFYHGQGVSSYQPTTPPSQQSANVSNMNNPNVPMLNMGQPMNIGTPVNMAQGQAQGMGAGTPTQQNVPYITYQPQPAHVYHQPALTNQIRPVSPQVVPFPSVQAHTHMPAVQTYQTVFRPNMQMPMQVQQQQAQPQGPMIAPQVASIQGSVNTNQVSANPSQQPISHVTVSAKGLLYEGQGQVPKVDNNGESKEQYSGGVTASGPQYSGGVTPSGAQYSGGVTVSGSHHQQVPAPVYRPQQSNQGVQYRPQVLQQQQQQQQQPVQLSTPPQPTTQHKPRSSVPSSPTPPKPQRVKKSRSRDSHVSQNSTESKSTHNVLEIYDLPGYLRRSEADKLLKDVLAAGAKLQYVAKEIEANQGDFNSNNLMISQYAKVYAVFSDTNAATNLLQKQKNGQNGKFKLRSAADFIGDLKVLDESDA